MPKATKDHELAKIGADTALAGVQGQDLSSRDFINAVIVNQNFFESIFNGCNFLGVKATQSVFQHTEFTESIFRDCVFEDSSFDHADFVLAHLENCTFARCTFQNAEWRDSFFSRVTFKQCVFRNTTTSLARFYDCTFDVASSMNFAGHSKRFSIFHNTSFFLPPESIDFLQTTFGLRARSKTVNLNTGGVRAPLFSLALDEYVGTLSEERFVNGVLAALDAIVHGPPNAPRQLRLRYITEIRNTFISSGRLPVFGIQYLYNEVASRVGSLHDRPAMTEGLSFIMSLRISLRERLSLVQRELGEAQRAYPGALVKRASLVFEGTYSIASIKDYILQLRTFLCLPVENGVEILGYRTGSTFFELLLAAPTQVIDLLKFFKYSLALLTITLKEATELKGAVVKLKEDRAPKVARGGAHRREKRVTDASLAGVTHRGYERASAQEIMATPLRDGKPIEVFVDSFREKVLVVGGKARITIHLS
jgi:Pentapeptide repeats (9 copies)